MIQNKKIQNLKELEYYTNSNLVGELILQLQKKEPTNETYRNMSHTYAQICLFVNELITNERLYEQSMAEYGVTKTGRFSEQERQRINFNC